MLVAYNEWLWPGQIAFVFAALLVSRFARRGRAKTVLAIAALAWMWTGTVFHVQHFSTINWASKYFAW